VTLFLTLNKRNRISIILVSVSVVLIFSIVASFFLDDAGEEYFLFKLFQITRREVGVAAFGLMVFAWLLSTAGDLFKKQTGGHVSLRRTVIINFCVLMVLAIFIEGGSSFVISLVDANGVTGGILAERKAPFIDPYSGKATGRHKVSSPFFIERYAPESLAMFYFDQKDGSSPKGLYTDTYGFIHNGVHDRDLRSPLQGGKRIFIFGGSSVAGANSTSSNEQTISAWIEKTLRSSGDLDSQVVNAGVEGFESFRENILAAHLAGQFSIDGMIFLNGRNDWYRGTVAPSHIWNYWGEERRDLISSKVSVTGNFIDGLKVMQLIERLRLFFGDWEEAQHRTQPTFAVQMGGEKLPADAMTVDQKSLFRGKRRHLDFRPSVLRNYIENLRSIAGLCIGRKISCIVALQPVLGYGRHRLAKRERIYFDNIPFKNWEVTQSEFFDRARDEFKKLGDEYSRSGVRFVDYTDIFDQIDGPVFLDTVHYLDRANCLIGRALASELPSSFNPDDRSHSATVGCERGSR